MKDKTLIQIEYNDIELYVDCEIHISLSNGQNYVGIIKDVDEEDIILSSPESKVCLGFQLDWINHAFVLEDDYNRIMGEDNSHV